MSSDHGSMTRMNDLTNHLMRWHHVPHDEVEEMIRYRYSGKQNYETSSISRQYAGQYTNTRQSTYKNTLFSGLRIAAFTGLMAVFCTYLTGPHDYDATNTENSFKQDGTNSSLMIDSLYEMRRDTHE